MLPLRIDAISFRGFRNLDSADVSLGPRFNVISGDNGQGKTNFIEALYVLASSRSFRCTKMTEAIGFGEQVASLRATVVEGDIERTHTVGFRAGTRAVKIDDIRPATLAEYAVKTPVVLFHPGETMLTMGPSAERRRLLDRAALYAEPGVLDSGLRYTKAMRARQKILETSGPRASHLADWEELMVRHGLELMAVRARVGEVLRAGTEAAFGRIGAPDLRLSVSYAPTAPPSEEAYRALLAEQRVQDAYRSSATFGPHRDDLHLTLNGHPARAFASQGQHRALTLALKIAEIRVIGLSRGVQPILLLDDVSSELDRDRTRSLFAFLKEQKGQVFITTTRPELIDTGSDDARLDWQVEGGAIRCPNTAPTKS